MFLRVSPDGVSTMRRYAKLATVLAELSGSLTTYLLIFAVIASPIESFYYYKTVMEKINNKVAFNLQRYDSKGVDTQTKDIKAKVEGKLTREQIKKKTEELRNEIFANGTALIGLATPKNSINTPKNTFGNFSGV